MRLFAVIALAILLAGDAASAQTANPPAAAAADDRSWSFYASAYTYFVPDDDNYVQPTVTADRGRLHLEARYNYENLETGSAWVGVNFGGGDTLEWAFTPMLGGVFGDTTGIAPGFKVSLSWRALELSSENEYVIDSGERSDSFFYNWSEVTLAPADWFRFGLVTQRTRVYKSDREIQRGLMAGFTVRRADFTGYLFSPEEDTARFVFAVAVTF